MQVVDPFAYLASDDFRLTCEAQTDIRSWVHHVREDDMYRTIVEVIKQLPMVVVLVMLSHKKDREVSDDNFCSTLMLAQFDAGIVKTTLPDVPEDIMDSRMAQCVEFINDTLVFGEEDE